MSEMMAICEHTEVSRHVKTRRRHEGAQPGEEVVLVHVGMRRCARRPCPIELIYGGLACIQHHRARQSAVRRQRLSVRMWWQVGLDRHHSREAGLGLHVGVMLRERDGAEESWTSESIAAASAGLRSSPPL